MDRLNLYLELEPGEFADLEVVARASLAFASAAREIAYIVDPSAPIKLELESGTEGSLSLNSVIRFIRDQVSDPITRRVIIATLLAWFIKESGSALLGLGISELITDDPAITEEDAQRIADKVQQLLERQVGKKPVQDVYRELHKDKSIKGVGVSTKKGDRPRSIVPREQFPERMQEPLEQSSEEPRKRTEEMLLTLIGPILQRNENKWRFLSKDGNVYIGIKDDRFLTDVLSGRSKITMRSGIMLRAEVEIIEKKDPERGVWVVTERNLVRFVRFEEGHDGGPDLFSEE